jgi:hypothetical protein
MSTSPSPVEAATRIAEARAKHAVQEAIKEARVASDLRRRVSGEGATSPRADTVPAAGGAPDEPGAHEPVCVTPEIVVPMAAAARGGDDTGQDRPLTQAHGATRLANGVPSSLATAAAVTPPPQWTRATMAPPMSVPRHAGGLLLTEADSPSNGSVGMIRWGAGRRGVPSGPVVRGGFFFI